jgi:hypothetical protein
MGSGPCRLSSAGYATELRDKRQHAFMLVEVIDASPPLFVLESAGIGQ